MAVAPIFSHELIGAVRDSDIIGGGGLTDLFHVPTELKEQDVDCGGYHHGDRTIRHLVSEPICQRKVIIDEGCRVDREALVQHDPSPRRDTQSADSGDWFGKSDGNDPWRSCVYIIRTSRRGIFGLILSEAAATASS